MVIKTLNENFLIINYNYLLIKIKNIYIKKILSNKL